MLYSKGDLHMHTNNSDGLLSHIELKNKIYSTGGNKVVSITDHNYMTDSKAYKENGVLWIPGIEVSATANGIPVHITGYGIEPHYTDNLKDILQTIVDGYNSRAKKIYEKWKGEGLVVPPLSDFRSNDLPGPIYTLNMVTQLGKIIGSSDHKYIRDWARDHGNLLFIEEEHFGIDVSELIPEMHKSGLISCWAHPGKNLFYHEKDSTLSNQTLTYIVDHKIDAIEVYANKHNKHQCEIFLDYCKEHDLLVLGGSDFHGDGKGQLDYPMGEELLTAFLHKVKG